MQIVVKYENQALFLGDVCFSSYFHYVLCFSTNLGCLISLLFKQASFVVLRTN